MWRSAISIIGLILVAAGVCVSCGSGDSGNGSGSQATCAAADSAAPLATCWVQLAPLGSGTAACHVRAPSAKVPGAQAAAAKAGAGRVATK